MSDIFYTHIYIKLKPANRTSQANKLIYQYTHPETPFELAVVNWIIIIIIIIIIEQWFMIEPIICFLTWYWFSSISHRFDSCMFVYMYYSISSALINMELFVKWFRPVSHSSRPFPLVWFLVCFPFWLVGWLVGAVSIVWFAFMSISWIDSSIPFFLVWFRFGLLLCHRSIHI